jgi:hypothetical protein
MRFAEALAVDKARGVIPLGVTVHSMSKVMDGPSRFPRGRSGEKIVTTQDGPGVVHPSFRCIDGSREPLLENPN